MGPRLPLDAESDAFRFLAGCAAPLAARRAPPAAAQQPDSPRPTESESGTPRPTKGARPPRRPNSAAAPTAPAPAPPSVCSLAALWDQGRKQEFDAAKEAMLARATTAARSLPAEQLVGTLGELWQHRCNGELNDAEYREAVGTVLGLGAPPGPEATVSMLGRLWELRNEGLISNEDYREVKGALLVPPAAAGAGDELLAQVRQLWGLHSAGQISREDFELTKKELLRGRGMLPEQFTTHQRVRALRELRRAEEAGKVPTDMAERGREEILRAADAAWVRVQNAPLPPISADEAPSLEAAALRLHDCGLLSAEGLREVEDNIAQRLRGSEPARPPPQQAPRRGDPGELAALQGELQAARAGLRAVRAELAAADAEVAAWREGAGGPPADVANAELERSGELTRRNSAAALHSAAEAANAERTFGEATRRNSAAARHSASGDGMMMGKLASLRAAGVLPGAVVDRAERMVQSGERLPLAESARALAARCRPQQPVARNAAPEQLPVAQVLPALRALWRRRRGGALTAAQFQSMKQQLLRLDPSPPANAPPTEQLPVSEVLPALRALWQRRRNGGLSQAQFERAKRLLLQLEPARPPPPPAADASERLPVAQVLPALRALWRKRRSGALSETQFQQMKQRLLRLDPQRPEPVQHGAAAADRTAALTRAQARASAAGSQESPARELLPALRALVQQRNNGTLSEPEFAEQKRRLLRQ